LSDHFSGTLLLGGFADLWASFFVADSSVQYLSDQAAKFVGDYSNDLIVSQTWHMAAIKNLEDTSFVLGRRMKGARLFGFVDETARNACKQ
jgi:hypothetical protein